MTRNWDQRRNQHYALRTAQLGSSQEQTLTNNNAQTALGGLGVMIWGWLPDMSCNDYRLTTSRVVTAC
jgi:hypothetical protein